MSIPDRLAGADGFMPFKAMIRSVAHRPQAGDQAKTDF